jgi:hypothetical protein
MKQGHESLLNEMKDTMRRGVDKGWSWQSSILGPSFPMVLKRLLRLERQTPIMKVHVSLNHEPLSFTANLNPI